MKPFDVAVRAADRLGDWCFDHGFLGYVVACFTFMIVGLTAATLFLSIFFAVFGGTEHEGEHLHCRSQTIDTTLDLRCTHAH